MQLTNAQRVAKLTGNLLRQPRNIPRYIAHNLIAARQPVDLELPWIAYDAIEFLKQLLQPAMRVFEFGSGGSTLFLARRCQSLTSVEHDARWIALVGRKLWRAGLTNVDLRHIPVESSSAESVEKSDYVNAVRQDRFDAIIVDGHEWSPHARPACFRAAEEQIAPGGVIVVDDSWRYQQLRNANRARDFRVFESPGPSRLGVTSTDIYFY